MPFDKKAYQREYMRKYRAQKTNLTKMRKLEKQLILIIEAAKAADMPLDISEMIEKLTLTIEKLKEMREQIDKGDIPKMMQIASSIKKQAKVK